MYANDGRTPAKVDPDRGEPTVPLLRFYSNTRYRLGTAYIACLCLLIAAARLTARQVLQGQDQGLVPQPTAVTPPLHRVEKLVDQRRAGQTHPEFAGRLQHESKILLVKVDHKAGGEIPLNHLRAKVGHGPGAGGPSRDCLKQRVEIQSGPRSQDQGLRHRQDG